jgi:hypothetical protein
LCHKKTIVDGKSFILFRPMSIECRSCHGTKTKRGKN